MFENQYSIHHVTNFQKMMFNDVKAWAQYRSPWNERLTKIYFPLSGTLTVLNVFDGLVLRAWDFLNSREADFPQGDSLWRWTAQEALARLCFCGGDNVPHSRKPGKCVKKESNLNSKLPRPSRTRTCWSQWCINPENCVMLSSPSRVRQTTWKSSYLRKKNLRKVAAKHLFSAWVWL